MNLRLWLAGALLFAAFAAGCAAASGHRDELLDRWTPSPDLLALAERLGGPDPAERETAAKELAEDPGASESRVLRAGLRLPDGPAALACAARMQWECLDDAESARCVELLAPGLFLAGWPGNFEEFRSYLGSDELGPILDAMPESPVPPEGYDSMTGPLSQLHRIVRPEHLPALCRLALHRDAGVRAGAFDCLHTILPYTDRHREEVARVLLALRPHWVRKAGAEFPVLELDDLHPVQEDDAGGPGYPPLLRTLLREVYAGDLRDRDEGLWIVRWAAAETPGPADAPLLLGLLDGGDLRDTAALVFHRALGALRDDASREWLRRRVDWAGDEDLRALSLEALDRRGEPAMLDPLAAAARESALAWLLLAGRDPNRAAALLRERFAGAGDEVARESALEFVEKACGQEDFFGLPAPAAAWEGIEEAAIETGTDGWTLARIAVAVPGCRTGSLARAAVAALRRPPVPGGAGGVPPPPMPYWLEPEGEEVAFLELAAPEEMRALLREWAGGPESAEDGDRSFALQTLIRLSDAPSAAAIVRWLESFGTELWRQDGPIISMATYSPQVPLDGIEKIPGPVIDGFLRRLEAGSGGEEGRNFGLACLAMRQGISQEVAWDLAAHDSDDDILQGRAAEALHKFACDRGEGLVEGLLDAGPGGAAEILRRWEESQEFSPVSHSHCAIWRAWIPGAPAELWRAFRAGRYRWIDEADTEDMILGRDLSTVPFWIDELEGACCRSNKTDWMLADRTGFSPFDRAKGGVLTPAAVARRWWSANRDRLRWSVVADRFVVGPER